MAFAGNIDDEDKEKHCNGKILAKFQPDDILLMYHSFADKRDHFKKGVVRIGEVLEKCDSKIYTD